MKSAPRVFLYILCPVLFVLLGLNYCVAEDQKINAISPEFIQRSGVMVSTQFGSGSGTIKTRNGVHYVLTAGHVVEDSMVVQKVVDPVSGKDKMIVSFPDILLSQDIEQEGRKVGEQNMYAEVVRFSNYEDGEDLAILRVRAKTWYKGDSQFQLDDAPPALTIGLWHVGSLRGAMGKNSITSGEIAAVGRVRNKNKIFDQITCTAVPGSSGGGVFRKDNGKYVGMVLEWAGTDNVIFIRPVREIKKWAKKVGVDFILDDAVPVPTDEDLKKLPINDIGVSVK